MLSRSKFVSLLPLQHVSLDIQTIKREKLLCSSVFEVPVYDWLAHFGLGVGWHKQIMAERIVEQNHLHYDLESKEEGRAWASISSFKHGQHPSLVTPLKGYLTLRSITLGPTLQHMGLWRAFNTYALTVNDPVRHMQIVLLRPTLLKGHLGFVSM